MFRRKLVLYTTMYAAGITAGYFLFETRRTIESAGFIIAVIAAVIFWGEDSARKRGQKLILIAFLAAGILMFTFRYIEYNTYSSEISQLNTVKGTVISSEIKEYHTEIIIRRKDLASCRILITGDIPVVPAGSLVTANGEYKELNSADNPGNFDYRLYMRSRGIAAGFRAYSMEVIAPGRSLSARIRRYLYQTRETFIGRFNEDTRGFIRGVIFGDKSEIDEDVLKEFNNNSTGHILAVSGLHMGFLYGLLRTLTGRKKSLPVSLAIVIILIIYGEMTMWSAATVRACIVLTISLFSVHLRRRADLLTSVSLAAFVILTYQPYQLFNSGFQMSFLALISISFLTRPISSAAGETLGVMLAVQAGTFPVIAYTFGRLDPLAIFINVPIILLSSVLVPLCILLLTMDLICGSVISFGIDLAELISYAVIKINHVLNFEGAFSFTVAGYGTLAVLVFYIFIFALSSEWMRINILRKNYKLITFTSVLLLMPVIMLSSCLYDRMSDDEIVFVAVGQGDCTHVRAGDYNVLIDGGGTADFDEGKDQASKKGYNTGEKILMPYLLREGAKRVDAALVTHLHTDHYKGIEELSEIYPVDVIGIPIDYRGCNDETKSSDGNAKESEHMYIKPDTVIRISDDVSIEVLWPLEISDIPISAEDPNEHNTVYMINYKDTKVMVTGDLLEKDELEMVRRYEGTDRLKCDVLKVAHHGSKSSSSEAFLDAASPKIAVIQAGRNNMYGHPHKQTLDRLYKRGIKVFRTDLNGAVGIDIRGSNISIDLFKADSE